MMRAIKTNGFTTSLLLHVYKRILMSCDFV